MSRKAKKGASDAPEMDDFGRPLEPIEPSIGDTRDANDPKRFDEAKKEEQRRRAADDLVLQNVMETVEGREWIFRQLDRCHIYGTGVDLGTAERPSDPFITYFLNGERNIGNQLLAQVQRAAPQEYMVMIAEQQKKKDVSGD